MSENFINIPINDLIGDFMGIDLGRLKSPLPDSELVLNMIRKLKETYALHLQIQNSMARKDFRNFLRLIRGELIKVEDLAEKTKVILVRLEEQLKSVEASLNRYRGNLKKRARKEPAAKQALQFVESLLADVRGIKNYLIDESRRSIVEERRIVRNI